MEHEDLGFVDGSEARRWGVKVRESAELPPAPPTVFSYSSSLFIA